VDDAYITFRHAQNLASGEGFSFNPGDRLLSTTSPLHALVLALFSFSGLTDLPLVAVWLSVVSMLVLCASILLIFSQLRQPFTGLLCVLLLVTQHWFYRFFSLETILVLALNTTAIALALRHRWAWAGLVAGVAMIGRPDSILVAGIIAFYGLVATKFDYRKLWPYATAWALSYGSWLGFSFFYFGSAFPNTLAAKSGFESWTVFISNIWPKIMSGLVPGYWQFAAILVIFAGIGCVHLVLKQSPLLIFPAWAILHILGYTLLRIAFPFAWYYAPLILIVILLASVGGMATVDHLLKWRSSERGALAWGLISTLLLFFLLLATLSMQGTWLFVSTYQTAYYSGARDQVYRQVGTWLAENSPPNATIALLEVGTVGYFSQRRIIDMAGLVTYELRNLTKKGTYRETIETLRPDYVVATRGLPPDPELTGVNGYHVVQQFPKGASNLFEDVVIYQLD
jgi:hypothetical protein